MLGHATGLQVLQGIFWLCHCIPRASGTSFQPSPWGLTLFGTQPPLFEQQMPHPANRIPLFPWVQHLPKMSLMFLP